MKKLALGLFSFIFSGHILADQNEIALAREGAPKHVSAAANVMVWEKGRYAQKVKGTNGFTCLVWADIRGTSEPSCFNAAAVEAVLPVYQFQRQMLEKKTPIQDIHATIAKKAESGEFPPPKPGAVVYMASNKNRYFNHFTEQLSPVEPHIMLYYPKLEQSDLGFNGREGTPGFYNDFPHLSVVHLHAGQMH